MNFGPGPVIPGGHMHQSYTDTLVKWSFDNFPMLPLPIVLVFFLITTLPRGLGARLSVQVPCIARWFPARARPCCIPTVPLHYILSNKSRFAVRTQQSGQIIHNLKTRHRASTSMYSLTFRVRVILPQQRNPCRDCKSAQ